MVPVALWSVEVYVDFSLVNVAEENLNTLGETNDILGDSRIGIERSAPYRKTVYRVYFITVSLRLIYNECEYHRICL